MIPENLSIGILAASAIGSELTQSSLDTFHHVGNSNDLVNSGTPRIQEIFNNSSTLNKIFFIISKSVDTRHLVDTRFDFFLKNCPQKTSLNEEWLNDFEKYFGQIESRDGYFLKFAILYSKQEQVEYFDFKLIEWPNFVKPIAMSPLLQSQNVLYNELIFKLDLNVELVKKFVANFTTTDEYFDFFLTKFLIPKLKNFKIFGVDNIEAVCDNILVGNSFVTLNDILYIDPYNIICNKTSEMVEVYGIEVARQCLIRELQEIMPQILPCHIIVIVDTMTWSGKICSISRYSARKDPDVLKRISFEEANRNIVAACQDSEIDLLQSTSSKLVASKLV